MGVSHEAVVAPRLIIGKEEENIRLLLFGRSKCEGREKESEEFHRLGERDTRVVSP